MTGSDQPPDSGAIRRLFYGPRELRPGWRLAIFLAIVIALTSAGNLLIRRVLHGADDTVMFLVREVEDVIIIVFVSWLMGRIEGRSLAGYGLPWRRMFRAQFWQGALLGFAFITSLLAAMRLAGVFSFGTIALHGAGIWRWAIGYALVFILVGLREEFRSRGYGLYTLAAGIGFWPAAILWSAFFGFAHSGNSGENWIGLINAGIFGLLACLLLRRTGNLWMSIGLHAGFDWSETFLYGVVDSGNVLPGHLLSSSSSGPAWLSGGTVGPEGSLLCTLVIAVVWAICAMWLRKVKYPKPTPSDDRP
jgi:membrane protease YdiL (CAAX protease family)